MACSRVGFPKRQFRLELLFLGISLCVTCFQTWCLGDNIFYQQGKLAPVTSTEIFVSNCCKSLLAKPVLGDQRISQTEYANFLIDYCLQQQACPSNVDVDVDVDVDIDVDLDHNSTFDLLNPNLQDLFIDTACPTGVASMDMCFFDSDEEKLGAEYGLIANPENLDTIDDRVNSLCTATFLILLEEGPWFDDDTDGVVGPSRPENTNPSPAPSLRTETETGTPSQYTFRPVTPIDDTNNPVPAVTRNPTFSPTFPPTNIPTGTSTSTSSPHVHSIFTSMPSSSIPRNVTGVEQSGEDAGGTFTTAAILGIISALAAIAFCVAVMYSGGLKEPEYDMNKPIEHPLPNTEPNPSKTTKAKSDAPRPTQISPDPTHQQQQS